MDRPDALTAARALVAQRFPRARAAWLAGSVVSGTAGPRSDLDVTVLLPGPPAPYRESLHHAGWPVEVFVHTRWTVERWLAQDRSRRRPTLARLVAGGVPLLEAGSGADGAEAGRVVAVRCEEFLRDGPEPLSEQERRLRRYRLTDLLDDLDDLADLDDLDDLAGDGADRRLRTAVAVEVWQQAGELLLAEGGCWLGTGKWLVRELQGYDAAHGTRFTARLDGGLLAALHGESALLLEVVDEVLAGSGGRLWAGHRLEG